MIKLNQVIALTMMMTLLFAPVRGEEYCDECCGEAYSSSFKVAYWVAAIPIGALVIAAIVIACNKGNHQHSVSVKSTKGNKNNRCLSSYSSSAR